ncbi:hypothetical protein GCM10023088_22050 [Actinomadura verrucosospora]
MSPLRLDAQATRKPHPFSTPPCAPPGDRLRTPHINASTAAKQVRPQLRARAPGKRPWSGSQGGPLSESRAPNKYPSPAPRRSVPGQAPKEGPLSESRAADKYPRPDPRENAPGQTPTRATVRESRIRTSHPRPDPQKSAAGQASERPPRESRVPDKHPQAEPPEERPWPHPHKGRCAKVAHQDKPPGQGPKEGR